MARPRQTKEAAKPELPSITSTVDACAGCDKELDLLKNHLKVMIKTARSVPISQPVSEYEAIVSGEPREPEEILAAHDTDVEEDSVSYLGERTGAGAIHRFHDFNCLVTYAEARKDKPVKLFFHREAEEGGTE